MSATFLEAEVGPSISHAGLRERMGRAAAARHEATQGRGRQRLDEQDRNGDDDEISDDDDALFDELERELEEETDRGTGMMGRLREQRMEELRRQITQEEQRRNAPKGSGTVTEPGSEKELMQILGDRGGELQGGDGGQPIIVHFFHKEFQRCEIMNDHLKILAAQHPETLFLKISVLASPFLVEKLAIKVLPCLVIFGRRVEVKDRVVGFEDLGNADSFTTRTLEWRLAQGGALHEKAADGDRGQPAIGFGSYAAARTADDTDLDWD